MSGDALGELSVLIPAGVEAAMISDLFWLMTAGAVLVWLLTMAAAIWAVRRRRPDRPTRRAEQWLIIGGGVVAPTLVLGALLIHTLRETSRLRGDVDGAQIVVTGERFWWRVQYQAGAADPQFELANEIRVPVGRRSELILRSPEVIHSLWIPSLAGKVDMLPGRDTRLLLEPTRVGRYRGVCAEYCGPAHARMAFTVEVLSADAFADWLIRQRAPARNATTAQQRAGEHAFTAWGCPACHAVRGTAARGVIGPDLTHLGSRPTLAAGTTVLDADSLHTWIRNPAQLKPGVLMPAFAMIPDAELAALSAYLLSLQ